MSRGLGHKRNSRFVAVKGSKKAAVVGVVLEGNSGPFWVVDCRRYVSIAVHGVAQESTCTAVSLVRLVGVVVATAALTTSVV